MDARLYIPVAVIAAVVFLLLIMQAMRDGARADEADAMKLARGEPWLADEVRRALHPTDADWV